MNKILFICCVGLLWVACENKDSQETPANYKPHLSNPEKPIVPVPNDSSFFGQIAFDKNNKIHILLPDSSAVVAEQVSPTTRKYHLAEDAFLIFSTKNYQNGFRIFSNDDKALWQINLNERSIEIWQQGMSKNKFEVLVQKKNLSLKKEGDEIGKVILEGEKAVFYKKDKQLFTIKTDMMLPAFGILLIDEMGIEEKYAVFAEAVARGY